MKIGWEMAMASEIEMEMGREIEMGRGLRWDGD
jgi:hypothetical protein